MACTEYFRGQVLSGYLSAYCPQQDDESRLSEAAFEWHSMPKELNRIAANSLSLEDGEDLQTVFDNWVSHTMGWKVGLLWTNQVAVSLGKLTRTSGCTLRDMYCMAVTDGLENSPAFAMVSYICNCSMPGLQNRLACLSSIQSGLFPPKIGIRGC